MQCASPLVLSSHWLEDKGDNNNSDVQLEHSTSDKYTYKSGNNTASLSVHGKLRQEKNKAVNNYDNFGSNGMRSRNEIQGPTQGPRTGPPISADTSSSSSSSSSSTSTPSLRHMICPIDIDDGDESDEPWIKLSEHIPAILSHALAILQVRHLPLSLRYVTIKSYPYQPYHIILHSNILKYITPHQIIRCQVTLYHPISYKSHRT